MQTRIIQDAVIRKDAVGEVASPTSAVRNFEVIGEATKRLSPE